MTKIKGNSFYYALMIFSGLLWVVTFHDFFEHKIKLFPDGYAYYHVTKFYLDNLLRGVFPVWSPFENWGMTYTLDLRFLGEYNPFLLVPLILYGLGMLFDTAYFIYAVGYYFLGAIGFFFIARFIFRDVQLASISFVLLLFSSMGMAIFFNYCEVALFVPAVWFFYFFLVFSRNFEKRYFLGMTFSLMIIMITYMPFYFLTIFLAFVLCFAVIYFKETTFICSHYLNFFKKHKRLTCFCLLAILLSTLPGIMWFFEAGSGEFVYEYRQHDAPLQHGAATSLTMSGLGGIVGPLTLKGLFSDLSFRGNHLSYFFLSIIIYPILLLSFINRVNKRLVLCCAVSLMIFLIVLTDVVGLHGFLYRHLFYFKIIRNIFYLLYLMIPFVILFVVEQLRLSLSYKPQAKKDKIAMVTFVIFVHVLFGAFLYKQGNIIATSYLTVLGSCLFFVLFFIGKLNRWSVSFMVFLHILLMAQPMEVFYYYCQNVKEDREYHYRKIREYPRFFYKRTIKGEEPLSAENEFRESHGFVPRKYAGVRWSYLLHKNMDHEILKEYVQDKFIAYDRVERIDDQNLDWKKIGARMVHNDNVAYVSTDQPIPAEYIPKGQINPEAEILAEDDKRLEVLDFDLNFVKLKTNFKQRKLLVYNDSYHSGWRAFINGQAAPILRANVAFKGVWLNPGENVVYMRFGSVWLYVLHVCLFLLFYAFFIFLSWLFLKPHLVQNVKLANG